MLPSKMVPFTVACWRTKPIQKRNVWTQIFGKTEEKISKFKQNRIRVIGALEHWHKNFLTNEIIFIFCIEYRKIPKISPGAYIFQRSFLRGLHTEGNFRFKIGYAYTGRKTCVSKSIGLAYSWKEIYVSNLQQFFTETRLENVDLSKTQPCKYFVCTDRGNPSQDWRVSYANSNILWHFFTLIIGHT